MITKFLLNGSPIPLAFAR